VDSTGSAERAIRVSLYTVRLCLVRVGASFGVPGFAETMMHGVCIRDEDR
jgi:hypothetical protein